MRTLSARNIIVGIIGGFILFTLLSFSVQAITMSNSSYIVQNGNLNSASGKKSNSSYKLNDTIGQIAPGLYSGTNYKVRAGFQYISSIIRFKFNVSSQNITFGILGATSPVSRTNILTITNGSAGGYNVYGAEDHQLLSFPSGLSIPNTTCDAGDCTTSNGTAWTSTLTYGFGYRCDNLSGTDCASGFSNINNYEQFADTSAKQSPVAVMTGTNAGRNIQTQITYKVNISASQASGQYINQINYVAVPTF